MEESDLSKFNPDELWLTIILAIMFDWIKPIDTSQDSDSLGAYGLAQTES